MIDFDNLGCMTGNALLDACHIGNAAFVRKLLTRKINLNATAAETGDTALHLAAENGKLNIVKMLINAGADPRICNFRGLNILHLAARYGSPEFIRYLLDTKLFDVNARGLAAPPP